MPSASGNMKSLEKSSPLLHSDHAAAAAAAVVAATAALLLLLQTPDAAEDAVGVQAAADY